MYLPFGPFFFVKLTLGLLLAMRGVVTVFVELVTDTTLRKWHLTHTCTLEYVIHCNIHPQKQLTIKDCHHFFDVYIVHVYFNTCTMYTTNLLNFRWYVDTHTMTMLHVLNEIQKIAPRLHIKQACTSYNITWSFFKFL